MIGIIKNSIGWIAVAALSVGWFPTTAAANPSHQVELELYDLQTQQSIYYKFDPGLGLPPADKPQIINLVRWQSQRTERSTSVLVKTFKEDSVNVVNIRFRGGQGSVEMSFECGPGVEPMPSANYNLYIQTKLRYEARITHNCPQPAAAKPSRAEPVPPG